MNGNSSHSGSTSRVSTSTSPRGPPEASDSFESHSRRGSAVSQGSSFRGSVNATPEWGSVATPEWAGQNHGIHGAPTMSPLSGYENSHTMVGYNPHDSMSSAPSGIVVRAPAEDMMDVDVSLHGDEAVDNENDGIMKDGWNRNQSGRAMLGTFFVAAKPSESNVSDSTDTMESGNSPTSAETQKMRREVHNSIAYGPSTEKRIRRTVCASKTLCIILACLIGVLAASAAVIAHLRSIEEGSSEPPRIRPLPPPTENTDKTPATPLDDVCNFAGQLQPSVFQECACVGRVSTIAEETLLHFKRLENTFVPGLPFTVNEKMDSCQPVNQALMWLASDKYEDQARERQDRFGLAVLYAAWGGLNWRYQEGWMDSTTSVCDWTGIDCDTEGRVVDIILNDNNLKGVIPKEILAFTNLHTLSVAYNHIEGTIPVDLALIKTLSSIRLSVNFLRGTIPEQLAALTALRNLELDFNDLTGNFPVALASLPHLEHLGLWDNKLRGSLPTEIGNFANMRELKIHANGFTGTVPSEIGNLSTLTVLNLARNDFQGSVPTECGKLTKLKVIDMDNTGLEGFIPTELAHLKHVEALTMSKNSLIGDIPTEFGKLTKMEYLYLNKNKLIGQIPTELARMNMLNQLRLEYNKLTGQVPTEFGTLRDLEVMDVTSNHLGGTMPDSVCDLRTDSLKTLPSDCNESSVRCLVPDCCTECADTTEHDNTVDANGDN